MEDSGIYILRLKLHDNFLSLQYSGVWQSNLLGTLRSKLVTNFSKYLLNVSAISKSSVSRLSFSIKDMFSKLFNLSKKELFTVSQNFLLSTLQIYVEIRIVCFFVFFLKECFGETFSIFWKSSWRKNEEFPKWNNRKKKFFPTVYIFYFCKSMNLCLYILFWLINLWRK